MSRLALARCTLLPFLAACLVLAALASCTAIVGDFPLANLRDASPIPPPSDDAAGPTVPSDAAQPPSDAPSCGQIGAACCVPDAGGAAEGGPASCLGTGVCCAGVCADLSSSTSCGACGNDCGGGACTAGSCGPPVPSVVFSGARLEGFGDTSYFEAPPSGAPTLHAHETVFLSFWWAPPGPLPPASLLWGAINPTSATGWAIQWRQQLGALELVLLAGQTQEIALGMPVLGVNSVAITNTGSEIRWSLNGSNAQSVALTITPLDVDQHGRHLLGAPYPGVSGWTLGGYLASAAWSRVAADVELATAAASAAPRVPASRFHLPDMVTKDAQCTYDHDAARDWDGTSTTSVSRGTAPVIWTVHGSPTRVPMSEEYLSGAALAAEIVDTAPPVIEGNHPRASSLARLQLVSPATQPQVGVAYVCTDPSGMVTASNEVGVFEDAAWLGDVPNVRCDGTVQIAWFPLGGSRDALANHSLTLVNSGLAADGAGALVGGYVAGLVTAHDQAFSRDLPPSRLVAYGAGNESGYGVLSPLEAWPAVSRKAFPGGVLVEAWEGRTLHDDAMPSLAASLVAECERVAAGGKKTMWIDVGFDDYRRAYPQWRATDFGNALAALVDAVHAADPAIAIYAATAPQLSFATKANTNGDTLNAFNAQILALANGRPWLTVEDTSPWGVTFGSDAAHLDGAGAATYESHVKTLLAY